LAFKQNVWPRSSLWCLFFTQASYLQKNWFDQTLQANWNVYVSSLSLGTKKVDINCLLQTIFSYNRVLYRLIWWYLSGWPIGQLLYPHWGSSSLSSPTTNETEEVRQTAKPKKRSKNFIFFSTWSQEQSVAKWHLNWNGDVVFLTDKVNILHRLIKILISCNV